LTLLVIDLTPKNVLRNVFLDTLHVQSARYALAPLTDRRTDQTQTAGHLNVQIYEQAEPHTK